jgi:mono/diheme cytochrome c family protein
MRLALVLLAIAAFAGPAMPSSAAGDAQRGRVLYEASCLGCHGDSVHGREKLAARDFEAVRGWVRKWSASLKLRWTDADVIDVAVHLNAAYYGFPCPPAHCTVTGGARGEGRVALDGVRR